ncbi:Maf family protein [Anianabacter salinae]|uniref:Maf family protein n=1 Tax=Anianabacter salinae TaxID=2851023 RepID=UPI00225DCF95|nr:Maf family protein [Anianabacter salinae]MBV0913512.1 Maf family protein [Anianabacter salinae]
MPQPLLLASGSAIRAQLLTQARVPFEVQPARIDEDAIRASMIAEGAPPRDIADVLAEQKARRVAMKHPDRLVLGSDQILSLGQRVFAKAETPEELRAQLGDLNGQRHMLHSGAVIYEDGRPVWRTVGTVRMVMRDCSDGFLDDYVARNWEEVRHSVGGYHLEGEGVRLFHRVEGDYFSVLGLPLLDLLSYLTLRGFIPA